MKKIIIFVINIMFIHSQLFYLLNQTQSNQHLITMGIDNFQIFKNGLNQFVLNKMMFNKKKDKNKNNNKNNQNNNKNKNNNSNNSNKNTQNKNSNKNTQNKNNKNNKNNQLLIIINYLMKKNNLNQQDYLSMFNKINYNL